MADFVLDASMALAWCFEDESTSFTDSILGALSVDSTCLVPPIWPSEVANGIRTAERRGRLSVRDGEVFGALLLELPIEVVAASPAMLFDVVLPLARDYDLTVYDAMYLDLALRMQLPLATLDDKLRSVAGRAGVKLR